MLQNTWTYRLFVFIGMALCLGCSLDASLIKDQLSNGAVEGDGRIPLAITMEVGSSKTIEPLGGIPPYTYSASTSGYLDITTGLYVIPPNAPLIEEVLEVVDSLGKKFAVTVHRRGFREFRRVEMPQSAQDQNFISDAVWLSSGAVLAIATASDNSGERWATYRSTDDGVTWSRVDHFMGVHYYGESHAMAMVAKGNTVFACGYGYSYNSTAQDPNSVWFIRRSTDAGTTWTTSDSWWEVAGEDYVCYDIAVSPLTGFIYSVGYGDQGWAIRESKDDGVTWQTIYHSAPLAGGNEISAYQVGVSPSGELFVMGRSGVANNMYFLKGVLTAGVWGWTPATTLPAVTNYGDYELRGNLRVLDDNTAYYSCSAGSGKIYKTADGGVTWSQVYSGLDLLQGMTVTSSGVLIATGGSRSSNPNDWKVVTSTDGVTWTPVDLDALFGNAKDPYGLTVVAHPSSNKVLAFSYNDQGYQSTVASSADAGATWSLAGDVRFQWAFWSTMEKVIRTSPTELYAIVDTGDMDGGWPWLISKSSDNGVTWQDSDRFVSSGYINADDLLQGHDGAIYAAGDRDGNKIIRRTVDGGVWTDVFSMAGTSGLVFLGTNDSTETYFVSDDGSNVYFRKTSDGTSWNLLKTFTLPGGVNEIRAKGLSVDNSGNIFLMIMERVNANGTIAVHRSADGGATWTEVLRGPGNINYWSLRFSLRFSPAGDVWVYEGANFFRSVDQGQTWILQATAPTGTIDISWVNGQAYYLTEDPDHDYAVVTVGETPGSWVIVESVRQRVEAGEIAGEYETELVERKFIVLGDSEVLLNYTYNDAYLGARTILRVIATK
nr:hypothetical protein HAGR004_22370 [Bdellovibrio sp. HAGR004]